MKRNLLALLGLIVCLLTQKAESAVGYVNTQFYPGFNFFSNPLNGEDNTANGILSSMFPTAPAGTALTYWTGAGWAPYSLFNGSSWSINYDLPVSQGAVLYTPAEFNNTFVGEVLFDSPPARNNNLYFLGSIVPLLAASFSDVIGRAPLDGESVTLFDRLTQMYQTRIYDSAGSGGWIDGDSNPVSAPTLAVAGAAFFGLGTSGGVQPPMPTPVPEPGSGVLLLIGAVMCKVVARRCAGTKP